MDFVQFIYMLGEPEVKWRLVREQIKNVEGLFLLYDLDSGGGITTLEMQRILSSFGHNPSESLLQHFIEFADMNGDGIVDFPEFAHVMIKDRATYEVIVQQMLLLRERFDKADIDHSGFIGFKDPILIPNRTLSSNLTS